MGKIQQFNGNHELAEYYFKQALEKGDIGAYYLLSKLYEQTNKKELTNEFLQKANELGVIY